MSRQLCLDTLRGCIEVEGEFIEACGICSRQIRPAWMVLAGSIEVCGACSRQRFGSIELCGTCSRQRFKVRGEVDGSMGRANERGARESGGRRVQAAVGRRGTSRVVHDVGMQQSRSRAQRWH